MRRGTRGATRAEGIRVNAAHQHIRHRRAGTGQHQGHQHPAQQKKLTIALDERVYEGLHTVVGRRRIRRFIESLVRPHVMRDELEIAYRRMAEDERREAEALEWAEATLGDVADETR